MLITAVLLYLTGLQLFELIRILKEYGKFTLESLQTFQIQTNFWLYFSSDLNKQIFMVVSAMIIMIWLSMLDFKSRKREESGLLKDLKQNHLATTKEIKRGLSLTQIGFKKTKVVVDGESVKVRLPKKFTLRRFWMTVTYPYRNLHNYFKRRNKRSLQEMMSTHNDLNKGGIIVHAERRFYLFGKCSRFWTIPGNNHSLSIGSTGRGKSKTYVLVMLFSWIFSGESFIVHDIKRELLAFTEKMMRIFGFKKPLVIDWTNPIHSEGWNPIEVAWQQYKELFEDYCRESNSNFMLVQKLFENRDEINTGVPTYYDHFNAVRIELEAIRSKYAKSENDTWSTIQEYLLAEGGEKLFEFTKLIEDYNEMLLELKQGKKDSYDGAYTLLDHLRGFDGTSKGAGRLSYAIEAVLDVSNALAVNENAKEKHWGEGASDMITGAVLYLFEEAILTAQLVVTEEGELHFEYPFEDKINFFSVSRFYDPLIQLKDVDRLCQILGRKVTSDSIQKMGTFITSQDVTRASYTSSFTNALKYLTATPAIRNMTSKTTFKMEDIFDGKQGVYLMTHDEKSTYYPLISLFFKQVYEVGIRVTRNLPRGELKVPMNFVIDEMAMLAAIKDIQNMYGAARSRNIRIHAWIQSIEQMVLKYGQDTTKVIEDNSTVHIFLGSTKDESRQRAVKMAGNKKVWNEKLQKYEEMPLLSEGQLKLLAKGRALVCSLERFPFMTKLPVVEDYAFFNKNLVSDYQASSRSIRPGAEKDVAFFELSFMNPVQSINSLKQLYYQIESIPRIDVKSVDVSDSTVRKKGKKKAQDNPGVI